MAGDHELGVRVLVAQLLGEDDVRVSLRDRVPLRRGEPDEVGDVHLPDARILRARADIRLHVLVRTEGTHRRDDEPLDVLGHEPLLVRLAHLLADLLQRRLRELVRRERIGQRDLALAADFVRRDRRFQRLRDRRLPLLQRLPLRDRLLEEVRRGPSRRAGRR